MLGSLAAAVLAASASGGCDPPGCSLEVRHEIQVLVPGISRVAVGNPEVLDVRPKLWGFYVTAMKLGVTTILADARGRRLQWTITVVPPKDPKRLVRFEDELPGSRCPAGGVRILSGRDVDGDQILQESEATSSFACRGTPPIGCSLDGDVLVRSQADWQRLVASGCSSLAGNLEIHTASDASMILDARAALETIEGSLSIHGNVELGEGLAALKTVGRLDLHSEAATLAAFPSLRIVRGDLQIQRCDRLEQLEFPSLVSLPGHLHVLSNPRLARLSLPKLTSVRSSLAIAGNPVLTKLSLPSLSSCAELNLEKNPLLPASQRAELQARVRQSARKTR